MPKQDAKRGDDERRASDYIDGRLPPAQTRDFEAECARRPELADLVADIRRVRDLVGSLGEGAESRSGGHDRSGAEGHGEPRPELYARLERRVAATYANPRRESVETSAPTPAPAAGRPALQVLPGEGEDAPGEIRRKARRWSWMHGAVAAAALAAAISLTVWLGTNEPSTPWEAAPADAYAASRQHYHQSVAALEKQALERLSELPPETARRLASHLHHVNRAISACEAAAREHPSHPSTLHSLSSAYATKANLLQRVVTGV